MRAGYCAVSDFAESPVDAVELLLRATTALRELKRDGDAEQVRAFDQSPADLPHLSGIPTTVVWNPRSDTRLATQTVDRGHHLLDFCVKLW